MPLILGYFTLALGLMDISPSVSRTKQKKLAGLFFDKDTREQKTPCYLIGQIGRDDRYGELVDGGFLIDAALVMAMMAREKVGGLFVRIDCARIDGLMRMYERLGFEWIQRNEANGLEELVQFF